MTGRFSYFDERGRKLISLVVFVEPNTEGWNIKDAVEHFKDSSTIRVEQGRDFFLLEGSIPENERLWYCEKSFLKDHHWINFTLYYDVNSGNSVEMLKDQVKKWCLI